MHIHKPRSWELPDPAVTPEADYLRLDVIFFTRLASVLPPAPSCPPSPWAATGGFRDPSLTFKLNGVKLTPYDLAASYNNFYGGVFERGAQGTRQQGLENRPWTIEVGGLWE